MEKPVIQSAFPLNIAPPIKLWWPVVLVRMMLWWHGVPTWSSRDVAVVDSERCGDLAHGFRFRSSDGS